MPKTNTDLGELSGPLLIFGGSYSNLQSVIALRKEAEQRGIPPERCICTGDIVAYCGQPQETVAAIRDWGVHCLMGNCEESFAQQADDCGCGFDEGSSCDLLSVQWYQFANSTLGSAERDWFTTLPRQIRFTLNGLRCLVIHGSVSSINQFVFASTSADIFAQQFILSDADVIIGGHSGIPFTYRTDTYCWHNAGAIGMPANDGSTQTWFSVLEAKPALFIQHVGLEYDHQQAYQAMLDAQLNNGYADALCSGLWPSMDVLPTIERQQRNQTITPINYEWAPQPATAD